MRVEALMQHAVRRLPGREADASLPRCGPMTAPPIPHWSRTDDITRVRQRRALRPSVHTGARRLSTATQHGI
ncbi:hypothetical protein T261_4864 [Streptomyces lydicus]|nr:hypothetical protein T261_4864 [Streptomyces lydicus]